MTKNGKEFHSSQLYYLKEKLLGYGADPLTLGHPINLLKGEKVDKNVDNNMRQLEILGKEKMKEFIQEPLINEKIKFLDTTKKSNFKTGIKSEKKSKNEIISTLQEDCQAF